MTSNSQQNTSASEAPPARSPRRSGCDEDEAAWEASFSYLRPASALRLVGSAATPSLPHTSTLAVMHSGGGSFSLLKVLHSNATASYSRGSKE